MKLTPTILALAISGALLSACDRPADKPATGKMGEAATGGTTGERKQDPRTTPKSPSPPASNPSSTGGAKP